MAYLLIIIIIIYPFISKRQLRTAEIWKLLVSNMHPQQKKRSWKFNPQQNAGSRPQNVGKVFY